MKYYKVEIDEEIHQYLLSKIKGFGDTPNTILRRELFKNEKELLAISTNYQFPKLPSGTPIALQHTLEVIDLVKKRGFSRVDATKSISKRHQVKRETVLDKYGRQLNKTTAEIDRLLEDSNLPDFKRLLSNKFPEHSGTIESFFYNLIGPSSKDYDVKVNSNVNSDTVIQSLEGYVSLNVLVNLGETLVNSKPTSLIINESVYKISKWTEFDRTIIEWFLEKGILTQSNLPINATAGKYFINSKPSHRNEKLDAAWKEVRDNIFFDSKFKAPDHVRNVSNLISDLKADNLCKIKLKIRMAN